MHHDSDKFDAARIARADRRATYWQKVARRLLFLNVSTFILGMVTGFIFHAVIAAPPVWIDDVAAAAGQCMTP